MIVFLIPYTYFHVSTIDQQRVFRVKEKRMMKMKFGEASSTPVPLLSEAVLKVAVSDFSNATTFNFKILG